MNRHAGGGANILQHLPLNRDVPPPFPVFRLGSNHTQHSRAGHLYRRRLARTRHQTTGSYTSRGMFTFSPRRTGRRIPRVRDPTREILRLKAKKQLSLFYAITPGRCSWLCYPTRMPSMYLPSWSSQILGRRDILPPRPWDHCV